VRKNVKRKTLDRGGQWLPKGVEHEGFHIGELLVYTRQFSQEWQTKRLRDTENERVWKYLILPDIKMRKTRRESTEVENDR
jgi:hypothetical protein